MLGASMSTTSLFRAEAIAFQRDPLQAGIALPVPPSAAAPTWLLLAMVCAAVALLAMGNYARKETVSGFLVPAVGVAKVLPHRAGLIVGVEVSEGQLVEAGASLLTVRVGQTDDRGSDVDAGVSRSLAQQRAAIGEQIVLEQTKSAASAAQISDRMAGLDTEIAALQSQVAAQRARSTVALDQVTAVHELVKQGYISVVEFKRRQDNYLAQRQNEGALAQQIAQKQGEATQQRHMLEQLAGELGARLSVLRASAAELDGRLAETAGRHAYLVRAPVAGRISALQARIGLAADPAIPLLAIVPTGDELTAELMVPARAIGFVEPGQAVRLAYEAFPYQRYGLHAGRVTTVSHNLLRPAELVSPVSTSEPSYRVTVALDRQTVEAFGRSFPLGADMTLKADIVFDRRSLFEWMFEPVFSLRGRWS
jgi:membrane fusion protein